LGCPKAAASGGTPHCKAHGGGRRCQHEGCSNSAVGAQYCKAHGGGKRRAAPSPLSKTARIIARRTEGAGGASTWAAPRQLLEVAHLTASLMAGASGASTRAAPRQSLKLQAARYARCVCGAHSRSPTMRRRSNAQDTTWHSAAAAGGGLRINQLTAEARPGLLIAVYVRIHSHGPRSQPAASKGTKKFVLGQPPWMLDTKALQLGFDFSMD
jgi:hypothetical protein